MFINYAHRGASAYFPENTLSSFYAGVDFGANGIETDVHMTKDGVLVLFHDEVLDRVTDLTGKITDYTYKELQSATVHSPDGKRFDKIPAFEDFLRYFGYRDLTFAVELKQSGVEKETIDLLEKYDMCEKTVLTSFTFANVKRAKEYSPKYKVGYLYKDGDEAYEKLRSIGGTELCPKAEFLTAETVEKYHALGITVRAWGIVNEELMKKMYDIGVDGMTVNFPDKLENYIKEQGK